MKQDTCSYEELPDLKGVSIGIQSVYYAPELSGIAPYTAALAETLQERGANVEVYTAMAHYPSWSYEDTSPPKRRTDLLNGVWVHRHRIRLPAKHDGINRARYEMSFAWQLIKRLPPKHDLNIAVVPSLGGGLAAALWSVIRRTPYSVVVQDLSGPAASQSGLNGNSFVAKAAIALERLALSRASNAVIVSESFRKYLIEYGMHDEQIRFSRNWSRLGPALGDRTETRRSLGWNEDEFIVLHSGNMGYKQGLDQLIDAARTLPSESTIRYVLMGDGNSRAKLEQRVAVTDRIDILDPVPEEAFADMLEAADALIVCERPSVVDMALPSKLASYFSAGRPIIAAVRPDGATAAQVRDSHAGLIVNPVNPHDLNAEVNRLQGDIPLQRKLSDAGSDYARQNLSETTGRLALARSVLAATHSEPIEVRELELDRESRFTVLRRRLSVRTRVRKVRFGLKNKRTRAALKLGVGASIEHIDLLSEIRPDTIVDVGANRGQFLLAAAETCPEAKIICAEPVAECFSTLELVASQFGERVRLHKVAFSDQNGTSNLFVSDADDNSSLHEPNQSQLDLAPKSRVVEQRAVQTSRLEDAFSDNLVFGTSMLKIDVQGHELPVLVGAGKALSAFEYVYVETSFSELYKGQALFSEVESFLRDAGFDHVSTVNPTKLAGLTIQADTLFRRRSGGVQSSSTRAATGSQPRTLIPRAQCLE